MKELIIYLLLAFSFLSGCQKIEIEREINIALPTTSLIGSTKIYLSAKVLDYGVGIKNYGFCWSTEVNPNITDSTLIVEINDTLGSIFCVISNLNTATMYHIKAFAVDAKGKEYYSDQLSCQTLAQSLPELGVNKLKTISDSSALVEAAIISYGANNQEIKQYGHCWSLEKQPSIEDSKTIYNNLVDTLQFESHLTGLKYHTVYYVRSYAINAAGISYGEEISIATKKSPPKFTYELIDYLTEHSSAGVKITILNDGGNNIIFEGVCYSTEPSPTYNSQRTWTGFGAGQNSTIWELMDLYANTLYYCKAFVKTESRIYYGDEFTIETKSSTKPVIQIGRPQFEEYGKAKLSFWLIDKGGENLSDIGICWSENNPPSINDNKASDSRDEYGEGSVYVDALNIETTYYLRAFATNSKGTSYSKVIPFRKPSINISTIYIEPLQISMGSTVFQNSSPIHDIKTDSFYIGRYEITNEQFCLFLNQYTNLNGHDNVSQLIDIKLLNEIEFDGNIYSAKAGKERYPVRYVSWTGANTFAQYAGGRLPTEAEWEYAAISAWWSIPNANYIGSPINIHDFAWYNQNSNNSPQLVGVKSSGSSEIYDQYGNVREWCSDWYDPDYYSISPQENPQGPATGTYKVVRGGSYLTGEEKCRVYTRDYASPDTCAADIGFRVVIPLD